MATWLTLLERSFEAAVLSRTDDARCSVDAVTGGVLSASSWIVVAVAGGLGESLGAEVGGFALRRSEPDMLKDDRDEREDVEGLGCKGEESSEGVAAPSICV